MADKYMEVTIKIVDNSTWQGEVVACPADYPEKFKSPFHREFMNFPNGTLIKATVRLGKSGFAMPKWEVLGTDVKGSAPEEAPQDSDPHKGWQQVSGVWFSPLEHAIFSALTTMAADEPANLLICGPSGFGKTARAKAWAEAHGYEFIRVNVALVRDTEEFFGYREAVSGSTVFQPTDFTQVIRRGNAIVLLDEINRAEPWILNALFPILDYERGTTVHNERIDVGDGVIFVATANIGLQFVGTFESDAALLNRMDARIEVEAPPLAVETELVIERCGVKDAIASKIVLTLDRVRKTDMDTGSLDISTRSALKLGRLIKAGLPIRNAFEVVVVNNATDETRKDVIDLINVALGELSAW